MQCAANQPTHQMVGFVEGENAVKGFDGVFGLVGNVV
jgi:hypothetical protein